MNGRCRIHGLLITYRRPDALRLHLDRLRDQTAPLDRLLVVDNGADPMIEQMVAVAATTFPWSVDYMALEGNPGPAGAIRAGIEVIVDGADDHDLVVLLDDDDPPPTETTLEELQASFAALSTVAPSTVGVGLWGASLRRRGRLRVARSDQPELVDYLPGGACPHYRVGALRKLNAPDSELFFGFDDLDLGLALRRNGGLLHSSGLARSQLLGHMVDGRRAERGVRPPTWRRYYSLRNLIVVLRRDRRWVAASWMTLTGGLLKPLLNVPRRPRVAIANLRLNWRAARDGWTDRLGKSIDPDDKGRA